MNVPLTCPLCPSRAPAIWRYNLKQHLCLSHADASTENYRTLWEISEDERQGMEYHWKSIHNSRTTQKKRKRAGIGQEKLVISDGHASRLTMRYVTKLI